MFVRHQFAPSACTERLRKPPNDSLKSWPSCDAPGMSWAPLANCRATATLSQPILLVSQSRYRNFAGQVRALSNVCSHRHCLISSRPAALTSHALSVFMAGNFMRMVRPGAYLSRRTLCHSTATSAVCLVIKWPTAGQLVFVNLSSQAPSLEEFLGSDFFKFLEQRFGNGWRSTLRWHPEFQPTGKYPSRNSLEAYHVPNVHPHTFKVDPGEDKSEHLLLPHRTSFSAQLPFCPHSRIDAIFQGMEDAWSAG